MFKRVDKRRRKKEEEQKLGLDEEVKEIFGIQDTDSEESDSDSDPGDGEEEPEEENSGADEEIDPGEDEDDAEEDPSITVSQALKDPLYVVSVLPDVKACIVCPGKLLKTVKMVQLHRTSNACTLSLVYNSFHLLTWKIFLRPIHVALNNSAIALQMPIPTTMPGIF